MSVDPVDDDAEDVELGPDRSVPAGLANAPWKLDMAVHLLDLFSSLIRQHAFRIKYILLNTGLCVQLRELLRMELPSFVHVAVLRVFKTCLELGDDFYTRLFQKENLLRGMLYCVRRNGSRDNLLAASLRSLLQLLGSETSARPVLLDLVQVNAAALAGPGLADSALVVALKKRFDEAREEARALPPLPDRGEGLEESKVPEKRPL